jgi:hypothetical protein
LRLMQQRFLACRYHMALNWLEVTHLGNEQAVNVKTHGSSPLSDQLGYPPAWDARNHRAQPFLTIMKNRLLLRAVACIALTAMVVIAPPPTHGRTWTLADGQRVLEANFVSLTKGVVALQTPDGKTENVPLADLSTIDRNLAERLGASSSKPVIVEVEGNGLTPDGALQNAFMHAVHDAIGARVKSKTVVEGDELVEDIVLVFSDGFISDYKRISTRQEAGLCHERIRATVQRRDVSEKPSAEEAARDASHLYAEAFTKVQRHRVAMAVLQDALDRFNADLLDVTLLGRDKTEVLPDDLEHVRIQCDLRVRISMDRYRELYDDLLASLTALARNKGGFSAKTLTLKPDDAVAAPIIEQLEKQFLTPTDTSRIDYGALFSLASDKKPSDGPDAEEAAKRDTDSTLFYVCVPPSGTVGTLSAKSCSWRWFEIDGHPLLPAQSITTVVRYTTEGGEPVFEDSVSFSGRTPGLSASGRGKKLRTVIVSPFFLYHISQGYFVADIPHAREITIRKKLRVPLDSLSRVEEERVFVTGALRDRERDFPPDVEGRPGNGAVMRNGRPVGGAERFALDGGVIEVQTALANNAVVILVSAKGFGGDPRRLADWLASNDFRQMVEQRVRAVARTGGSWKAEFGPYTKAGKDLVTIEVTIKRQ